MEIGWVHLPDVAHHEATFGQFRVIQPVGPECHRIVVKREHDPVSRPPEPLGQPPGSAEQIDHGGPGPSGRLSRYSSPECCAEVPEFAAVAKWIETAAG